MPDEFIVTYRMYCETIDLLCKDRHIAQAMKEVFRYTIINSYKLGKADNAKGL